MHTEALSTIRRVGLIGIGLVGTALAERLLHHQIDVLGYDIDTHRLEALRQLGGRCATSPREVAGCVDYCLLSLPETTAVCEVLDGTLGILSSDRHPRYVIDTSTGDPEETVQLAGRLAKHGVTLLEATICGASSQISDGTAVLMVGGDPSAWKDCEALLRLLVEHVFYVGPSGSGSKAKLATNLVLGLNRLVLAEGMVFAERIGLSLETFLQLLRVSPAYSGAVDVKGQKMLEGDFEPVSRIHQHHKDVSLMIKHARQHHQGLPLSELHLDILEKAIAAGEGQLDTSAVIKELRRRKDKSN